ncbi:MAG: hypothetical protein DDT33_01601 [Firmicutes bacterium]|nr:hypothetical protein [Bacillota bacterium]
MKYCKECKVTFNPEKYKQKDAWGNWFYPCPQCRDDDNVEDVVEDVKKVEDDDGEASSDNDNNDDNNNNVGVKKRVIVKIKKKKKGFSVRSVGVPKEKGLVRRECPVCGVLGGNCYVRQSTQELVCRICGCVSKGKIIKGEGWRPLGYKE